MRTQEKGTVPPGLLSPQAFVNIRMSKPYLETFIWVKQMIHLEARSQQTETNALENNSLQFFFLCI